MSGKRPQECDSCKYALEEEEIRREWCQRKCGGISNSFSPAVISDLMRCHLRMLGGERIDHLPESYYMAIGTMRMEMMNKVIENNINRAIGLMFGGIKQ